MYLAAATALLLAAVAPAATAAIAVTEIGNGTTSALGNGEYGWRFSLSSDITVTHLGVWDSNGDGLEQSVTTVRIWSSTREVLASAAVPGGEAAPLTDGFRYAAIDDLLLEADGGTYYISATSFFSLSNPQSAYLANGDGLETAGPITLEGSANAFNPGQFPSGTQAGTAAYFGASFQFVPAPGAAGALALAGLTATRRRR
jgi:hypothetical protein